MAAAAHHAVFVARRWGAKGALALADQGLLAGANFLFHVFLARELGPGRYGAFAIAFSIFLFLSGFHNALVLEPMVVIGPARHRAQLGDYLDAALSIHWRLTLVLGGLLACAGLVLPARGPLMGLAVATPFILLFWLFRRACYLIEKPQLALAGTACYAVVLLAGVAALSQSGWLSVEAGLIVMGVAGLVSSLGLRGSLALRPALFSLRTGPEYCAVKSQHWRYGRWVIGQSALFWLAGAAYFPLVGALAAPDAAGLLRASENLLAPVNQVMTAAGLLLLPGISAQAPFAEGRLRSMAVRTAVFAGSVTALYVVLLELGSQRLVPIIYGSNYAPTVISLLPLLGVVYVLRAVSESGVGIVLRAAGRPNLMFWATLAGAVVTLSGGAVLVARYGVRGAAWGWLLSAAAQLAVLIASFRFR